MKLLSKILFSIVTLIVGSMAFWFLTGVSCTRYNGLVEDALISYNMGNLDSAYRLFEALSSQGVGPGVTLGIRLSAINPNGPRSVLLAKEISIKSRLGFFLGQFYLKNEIALGEYDYIPPWLAGVVTMATEHIYWPVTNEEIEELLHLKKKGFLPYSTRKELNSFPQQVSHTYWKGMYLATLKDATQSEMETAVDIFSLRTQKSKLFPEFSERAVIAHFITLSFGDEGMAIKELSDFWSEKAKIWGWKEPVQ
ncbi:hypothetical protein [Bdellovibrio bacteriovorus]|uniref:hypothetical protein n=1 Tax=Bdellovibrio bacteriovorus TaxID=959 RepID=UPI0035A8DE1D